MRTDNLLHVRYPLITDEDCEADSLISANGGITDDQHQCAGYDDYYIVTCSVSKQISLHLSDFAVHVPVFYLQGDSGGPLACRDSRNVWTVVGALSYGVVQSEDVICQSLDVYTEVAAYRTWIETTISNAEGI